MTDMELFADYLHVASEEPATDIEVGRSAGDNGILCGFA
ncbi:unnamed protein product [Acidithrix sp. C25]|nr:unnamed protein product [Acidithrix sp. C25]